MKTNGSINLLELLTFTVILQFFSEFAVEQVTSRAAMSSLSFRQRRSRKKAVMYNIFCVMLLCRLTPSPQSMEEIPRLD